MKGQARLSEGQILLIAVSIVLPFLSSLPLH